MTSQAEKCSSFSAMHAEPGPLLLANAWDVGSAGLFASLGYRALATTSSGYAASEGRLDYGVEREQAIGHAARIVAATELPVSADLEDCFATDASGVAQTIALALQAGLAGASIEDFSSHRDAIYPLEEAVERVAAAVEAAHSGEVRLVLTARAENYLHGEPDLADTIARLQAYEAAGADVLYAPALQSPEELRELLASVERPVNVLLRRGPPSVAELGELGVARLSVGGAFAFAAYGAATRAAAELIEHGTTEYLELSAYGGRAVSKAFGAS
jgi:2-methylisocitrate lyase-like PEP mutase family enzyme